MRSPFVSSIIIRAVNCARMTPEEYLDFRRQFMRKAEKFTAQVFAQVRDAFPFRQLDYYPRSELRSNQTGGVPRFSPAIHAQSGEVHRASVRTGAGCVPLSSARLLSAQ